MKKNISIFLPGVIILLALALFLVEVPYTIRAKGLVKPVKEWYLQKAPDGTLVNILEDHITGSVNEYKAQEFQRGDVVHFSFNEHLLRQRRVHRGDTIAWVLSHDIDMQIVRKKGELAYQEALKEVYLTGEKPEAVQMAEEEVELARQEFETQKKITDRIQHLYEEDLVSEQDYELAVNDLKVKQYALEIARANYQALVAGEKEEEISVIRSRESDLAQQIIQLENLREAMHIIAPISGQVIRQRGLEQQGEKEVIRLADMTSVLAFVPVDSYERVFIESGQVVWIRHEGSRTEIKGTVHDIDNSVQMINNQPKVFVTIMIEDNGNNILLPNMIIDARIQADTLTLMDYLLRITRVVYHN